MLADDRLDLVRHVDVLRVRHAMTDDGRLEGDHRVAGLHGVLTSSLTRTTIGHVPYRRINGSMGHTVRR